MFIKQLLLYLFLLHNNHGDLGSDVPLKNKHTPVDVNQVAKNIESHRLLRNLLDTNVSTITKIALIELYMGDKNRVSGPNLTNGLSWE